MVRYVIANDLSSAATEAMRRNVEINELGSPPESSPELSGASSSVKVRINEGDAWYVEF